MRARVDPAQAEDVTRVLTEYLTRRSDLSDVRLAEAPAAVGKGFDSFIYGFRIQCCAPDERWLAPLILRLQRKPEYASKVRREAEVQAFMAAVGYPTPRMLAVEDEANAFGLPFSIMERVPGTTMLARVMSNPLRAPGLLQQLGELHARMHRLPADAWRFDESSGPIALVRLARTRQGIEQLGLSRFEDQLGWLEQRARDGSVPETRAITHNDYHPLNVLATPDGQFSVIDWSDAAVGDRHFDVARTVTLFSFAYIAASSTLERMVLKAARGTLRSRYLKGYEAAFPLDPQRLAYFEALQSMYALVQLYELQAEPVVEDVTASASRMLRGLPDLIAEAETYVDRRIADARRLLAH